MRLNWNNIGRGMSDVANTIKEKRLKDDLAAVNAAKVEEIDVTQGIDPNAAGAPEGGNPDVYAPTEIAAGAPQSSGISKRYRMFDVESDKPLTQEEVDDLRMSRMADVYTKHGQNDRAFAIKEHLSKTQRQRKQDARADEEFTWKKEDRAADKANSDREAAVRQGITKTWANKGEADPASDDAAAYQRSMVGVVEGKGLESAIRKAAGPNATKDEIDAAIEAYRGSLDEATASHNAAGMSNLYKQQAQIFGEIGGDPTKAAEALKLAEAEGLPKLIQALKSLDIDGANKLWNTTGQGRGIVKSVGKDSKSGDLFAEVIDPYSGKKIGANGYVNISAIERAMMSAQDAAKMRETESKIGENDAQAQSARAAAGKYGAEAEQSRAETNRIRNGLSKSGDAKVEGSEVSSVLGTPAVDRKGKPLFDPVTGRQQINRNMAEEDAFYRWMAREGLNDTNAALLRWKSGEREANMPKPEKPKPAKPFNPEEFMRR
jgi:hypothetical protein